MKYNVDASDGGLQQDLNAWLRQVTHVADIKGLEEDKHIVAFATTRLTRRALQWFDNHPEFDVMMCPGRTFREISN